MTIQEIFSGAFTPAKWQALGRYLMAGKIRGGVGIRVMESALGVIISAAVRRGGGGGSGGLDSICYFGEIINYSETDGSDSSETAKKGIRGGYVEAGNKTWRVPNREINLGASGVFPVWLRIAITANTDADDVATLSGIKTSERPTWEHGEGSEDYEDKVIPEIFPLIDPGAGVAIVPIGVLTIADGVATLERTGCGNIIITHCPGNLTHIRGPVGSDSISV
jgi:hypothetical protein